MKTLKAVEEDVVFKADIDQKLLDKIGETIGTIELVGNKAVSYTHLVPAEMSGESLIK